jgi:signal peptidase I
MAKRKARSESDALSTAPPRRDWRYWVRIVTGENVSGLLKLLIAFLVLQWLVVQQFSIPSGSMEPTLHGDPRFLRGDRVLVNKWVFGPRLPFSNTRVWDWKDPERWDIVVFHAVQENAEHGVLIKRVVGLPGEHVQIGDSGDLVIDGEVVEPPPDLRAILHYTRSLSPHAMDVNHMLVGLALRGIPAPQLQRLPDVVRRDLETIRSRVTASGKTELTEEEIASLLEGVSPVTVNVARSQLELQYQAQASQKPFRYGVSADPEYSVVPEGHYFVLGDNSGNSVDGRFFGWVPKDHILGRATSIWWPFTRARDFTGWTGTVWGKLILYGIPALWIGYEICVAFFFCSWRVRRSWVKGLERGDRVLVNRIALGMRIPFTARRLNSGKALREGDLVLTRAPEHSPDGFAIARVAREDGKASEGHSLTLEAQANGKTNFRVPSEYLVGTVGSVWWPPRRRRKLVSNEE